jgi:hypothetical protein
MRAIIVKHQSERRESFSTQSDQESGLRNLPTSSVFIRSNYRDSERLQDQAMATPKENDVVRRAMSSGTKLVSPQGKTKNSTI